MKFAEKLTSLGADITAIRESMTVHDPRSKDFSPSFGKDGYRAIRRQSNERWGAQVAECAKLVADVVSGRRPEWVLKEAMTTSDFPELFGDMQSRQLLGNYRAIAPAYPPFFRFHDLKDFRVMNLLSIEGGGTELDRVNERAPYPEATFTETKRQLQVAKFGRRYGVTFEMGINDDLDAFTSRPQMMAHAARVTEELLAMRQMFDVNGPHAGFFTSGNGNLINNKLNLAGLQAAFKKLAAMRDSDGNPIQIDAVILGVVPNLEVEMNNILNSLTVELKEAGGTSNQTLTVNNWMTKRIRGVVLPYQPLVATAETTDNWVLAASPNQANGRAAFRFGFLRGRRDPQLFIKDSNQRQLGGGDVPESEGDFDTDAIDYKVRHIIGASQDDPKLAIASDGSGS